MEVPENAEDYPLLRTDPPHVFTASAAGCKTAPSVAIVPPGTVPMLAANTLAPTAIGAAPRPR